MSDETEMDRNDSRAGSSSSWTRRNRWLLAGASFLVAGAALLWLRHEAKPSERDYHVVQKEFARIEQKIHQHDMSLWLVVEGEPHDRTAGAPEERHRRILRDFDTMSDLPRFEMSQVNIEILGDRAKVRYALQSWPQPWRPMPSGGRMEFVRRQDQWVLHDHHFLD